MQYPALVLNADFQPLSYFPLSTINWHDAVKGVYERTHAVVEEYDMVVRSPSIEMRLPSVLALVRYHPVPKHVAFTRFNVFLRDRFRCQYCGGANKVARRKRCRCCICRCDNLSNFGERAGAQTTFARLSR